ncbi:HNH endonuclease signature motif containing protein [Trinickia sp.]|uniref:HNH endonuclease signature motif containing protein n=1 Tax=Trinickia sp. TaxID=2571163 RepID=UPI003F807124
MPKADHRPEMSNLAKKRLRAEAGGKCANPGCAAKRTEIHHIREWAVYRTHDEAHMIAICPTCHDAVHHGRLEISDETLYRWKNSQPSDAAQRGMLYVQPAPHRRLRLGTIWVTREAGEISAFDLGPGAFVKIVIEEDDILLLDLTVTARDGTELARISRYGHTKTPTSQDGVEVREHPGAIAISVPCNVRYLPEWLIDKVKKEDPEFDQRPVEIFHIEVTSPGEVRIKGLWFNDDAAVRVTDTQIQFFLAEPNRGAVTVIGDPVTGTGFTLSGVFGAGALFQMITGSPTNRLSSP